MTSFLQKEKEKLKAEQYPPPPNINCEKVQKLLLKIKVTWYHNHFFSFHLTFI